MRFTTFFAAGALALALTGAGGDDVRAQAIPGVPERFGGPPDEFETDPLLILRGAETVVLTASDDDDDRPNVLVEPVNVAGDGSPLAPEDGEEAVPADATLRPGLEQAVVVLPAEEVTPGRPEPPADFDTPPVDAVDTRDRPELDPLGIRVGSFIVNTDTELGVELTDNVFGTGTDRESDTLRVVRPSAEVRSNWNNHALGLRFNGEYGSYRDNPSENPIETELEGFGRLDVTRDTALGLRTFFAIEQESRGSVNVSADASEPTKSRTYGVAGDASHRFNRLTVALRGGVEREDFDDSTDAFGLVLNNDDRDVEETEAGLRATYALSPMLRVYGDAELRWRRFDQPVDDSGFDRSADIQTYAAGVQIQPAPTLRADVEIGFVHEDLDDPLLEDLNEIVANLSLRWSITPLTTLGADVETELDDTTIAGASAEFTRRYTASIEHEFLRQFVVRAEATYEDSEFKGIDLEETTYSGAVTMEYWISRSMALLARYEHETETGQDNDPDEIENVVMIGVRLRH